MWPQWLALAVAGVILIFGWRRRVAHLEYIGKINPEAVKKMADIRSEFIAFHRKIESLGRSRELSIALTEIENALMWTMKHLAIEGKE